MLTQGLVLLLLCTPLAFGTVQPWSIAAMEIVAFGVFFLHVGEAGLPPPAGRAARAVLILFTLLTALLLLQLLPLPPGVLGVVSPASLRMWRTFGDAPAAGWRPVSICPDATRQELLKLLAYAAVFIVVVRRFRHRRRLMLLVKTIIAMAGLLAVLAVAQKLTWNGRILWVFPVEEYLRTGSSIWGPYVNHNHFAFYLEMSLFLALGLLLYRAPEPEELAGIPWGRRFGRFLSSEDLSPFVGISLLVLLVAACLLATLSRGAIVASGAAALFFAWSTHRRNSLRARGFRLFLAAAAIGLLILVPTWERVVQRFADIGERQEVTRLYILEDSLALVRDFPYFGTGFGTFDQGYRRYQTRRSRYFFDHAHDDFLEMATDTGAAGFLLAGALAATFFFVLMTSWREMKSRFGMCLGVGGLSALVALAVHSCVDFNLRIPANALLSAVIAGITYTAILGTSRSDDPLAASLASPPDRVSGRRLPLRRFGLFPLALLSLYLPVRDLVADYRYQQIARVLDDKSTLELDVKPIAADTIGSYLKAIDSLKRAAGLAPSRLAYPKALAELYLTLGDWAESMESLKTPLPAGAPGAREAFALAIVEARRAIRLDPANPDHHLALGRIYAAADGDLERGDREIRLALAAYPVSVPLRYAAAMTYLLAGRPAQALEQAREMARLDDGYLIRPSAEKVAMIGRRDPAYLSKLQGSFLFKAFEIAWRVSGDAALVRGLAPDDPDAAAVLDAFLEWQGIGE